MTRNRSGLIASAGIWYGGRHFPGYSGNKPECCWLESCGPGSGFYVKVDLDLVTGMLAEAARSARASMKLLPASNHTALGSLIRSRAVIDDGDEVRASVSVDVALRTRRSLSGTAPRRPPAVHLVHPLPYTARPAPNRADTGLRRDRLQTCPPRDPPRY